MNRLSKLFSKRSNQQTPKAARIFSALVIVSVIVSSVSLTSLADNGQKWNLGTLTKTGMDNGYTGEKKIDNNDPHYGWNLGQFYVQGFTQRTTDKDNTDIFLKNVGDKVELHFELLQDIDCLNGNKNLSVNSDRNGYDQYFKTQKFNDCRGLLIIRKTDYQNKAEEPVVYSNYLDGVKQGADTVVEFCEEGDYEVALDYELKLDHYGTEWNTKVSVPTYTNYRIFFTFKIRNGNCMVFPFDTKTGSELTNEAFTENGFYLDLANSRYLEINVQRAVYVENEGGYTEDIRFNRPASDGTKYTDDGVYTITVKNVYTNQTTEKVIYVGTDPIMRAYVVTGYSLKEIKQKLEEGYTISDSGDLVEPERIEETEVTTTVAETTEPVASETSSASSVKEPETTKKAGNPIPVIIVIVVLVIGAGVFVFLKRDMLFAKRNNKGNVVPNVETAPKETENVISEAAPVEASEESTEEISEDTPKDIIEDKAEEHTAEPVEEIAEEPAEETSNEEEPNDEGENKTIE